MKLPQPFDQKDIRKDPKAVVIGLLIGLLLLFSAVISFLYYRKEDDDAKCNEKVERLYSQMLESRNQRIFFYEQMIFYKRKFEDLEQRDSLLKKQTQPLMQKIYNYENPN